ncbi:MAG: 4-hydroxy-3-methylbut-2-enyl diphosphate reductase [Succinivibrio sp.]|nr:4-hydroxy-3-methylbut-2-enyl diphosphate reductase [Succinivibrio sp.]
MSFEVILANLRGMCQGVSRAIATVEHAIRLYGPERVWVLHEVVHNKHVVADLAARGAHFVESLEEVPDGSVLIFSAHGVSIETEEEARRRGFTVIDATCPVVAHIHRKLNQAGLEGLEAVVIGHNGHQEVLGTIGQYRGDKSHVHVVLTPEDVDRLQLDGAQAIFATQTTLSVDETAKTVARLKERFPEIRGPKRDDTCTATQDRQNAIRELAQCCDLIVIAGSANSSNSNRLREVAESAGVRAYLVDDYSMLDDSWFEGVSAVGISAGASAPEYVVEGIVDYLKAHGAVSVSTIGREHKTHAFPLPHGI